LLQFQSDINQSLAGFAGLVFRGVFQKLTSALNERCSGPKGPYDRWEERILGQSQAALVVSLISRRTIPARPRYVDGSDTIPRSAASRRRRALTGK
jgi:hypothetical protein